MREHPLLMKGPLVRATLEGRKTQTRRPVKGSPLGEFVGWAWTDEMTRNPGLWLQGSWGQEFECPLGRAGDRLWVRETFAIVHGCKDIETGYIDDWMVPRDIPKDNSGGFWTALHRAADRGFDESKEDRGFSWRPAIHMPRWACRLVLPQVSVRVERVQDITEEDAKAEGVEPIGGSYREGFRSVMQAIYGKECWDANWWVWVAEWKEIEVSR